MPPRSKSPKGKKAKTKKVRSRPVSRPATQEGSLQITRFELLSYASSAHSCVLTELKLPAPTRVPRQQDLHAVNIAGVAEVEIIVADDEAPLAADAGDGPESGEEKGDHTEVPEQAAALLAKLGRRTKRLRKAAAKTRRLFGPTQAAIEDALEDIENPLPDWPIPEGPALVIGRKGMDAWGTGVGHPVIRLIQRIARRGSDIGAPVARVAELAGCQFFRQYPNSNGTSSLSLAVELLCNTIAATKNATANASLLVPTPHREDPQTVDGPYSRRETWLHALHPQLHAMRSIFCATRAESPDIHLHLVEVGVDPRDGMISSPHQANSRTKAGSRSPGKRSARRRVPSKGAPAMISASSAADHLMDSSLEDLGGSRFEMSEMDFSLLDRHDQSTDTQYIEYEAQPCEPAALQSGESAGLPIDQSIISSVGGHLTTAAMRRLQFWDGFFAFRSLGAVSWELAAKQLDNEKEPSDDEDIAREAHYMYNLSPTKKSPNASKMTLGSLSTLSPFVSTELSKRTKLGEVSSAPSTSRTSARKGSKGSGGCVSDSVFPSLGQRRKCRHLAALRRPPGATAELSPRRPVDDDAAAVASPVGAMSVDSLGAPGQSLEIKELPPLVAAAKLVLGTGSVSQESEDKVTSSPATDRDPLMLPMFIGSSSARQKEENRIVPFVAHSVGFEVQPLASAKARRVTEHQTKAQAQTKTSNKGSRQDRLKNKRLSSSSFDFEPAAEEEVKSVPRCRYCLHHDIKPSGEKMQAAWSRAADVRHQRGSVLHSHSPLHAISRELCSSCGGDLDTDFIPRPPKLLVEACLGTPVESAPTCGKRSGRTKWDSGEPDPVSGASPEAEASTEQAGVVGPAATVAEADDIVEALRAASPARTAGVVYEQPKRILSDNLDVDKVSIGNVYFVACERNRARPLPEGPPALTESGALASKSQSATQSFEELPSAGDGVVVSMRAADLDDKGLVSFIESLTQKRSDFSFGGIHIDLAKNRLTDDGVHRLLSQLEQPLEWARRLESLDLAMNRMLSARAIEPLCSLLADEKLGRLRTLRLGGIELAETFTLKLFKGVDEAASSTLEELDISFLGLGRSGPAGPTAAARLVRQCTALCTLDISGNHVNFVAMASLGNALAEGGSVQTLHLAHNTGNWPVVAECVPPKPQDFLNARRTNLVDKKGAAMEQPFAPQPCTAVCALCEHLSRVQNLRVLDLRNAQVDPRCAFMIACAVFEHKNLEAVLLNGNPLGFYGVRALLSIAYLAPPPRDATDAHMSVLTLDQCSEESMLARDTPPLSPAEPSGSYVFDLRDAWSQAAVQYCLRRWSEVRSRLPFEEAFPFMELDGKAVKELAQCPDGRWDLPRSGILSFTFLLPNTCQGPPQAGDGAFRVRPQDHHRRFLTPEFERRVLSLAAACHSLLSLQAVAHALAADFRVRGIVANTICQWLGAMGAPGFPAKVAAAEALYDGVADTDCELELYAILASQRVLPSPSFLRDAKSTLDYVVCANPTGRYVLNLTWPSDRIIAEDLLLVNNWEVELAKSTCAPDTSQKGNYQYLRNEAINADAFVYRPDWVLPTSGILEFDLAISRRLPKSTKALDEDSWQQLKTVLEGDPNPVMVRALCLRRVSPRLCFSSQQALELFEMLAAAEGIERPTSKKEKKKGLGLPSPVELTLFSILIFRIKDYQNTRQTFFKSPGPFAGLDRLRCCERFLGCLNLADAMQVNQEVRLNLAVHEERQYCRMILNIAYWEGGRTLDPKSFATKPPCAYGPGNPGLRPVPGGCPPDRWLKTGLPTRGVLVMTYTGDEGNVRYRKRQAAQICRWEI